VIPGSRLRGQALIEFLRGYADELEHGIPKRKEISAVIREAATALEESERAFEKMKLTCSAALERETEMRAIAANAVKSATRDDG